MSSFIGMRRGGMHELVTWSIEKRVRRGPKLGAGDRSLLDASKG